MIANLSDAMVVIREDQKRIKVLENKLDEAVRTLEKMNKFLNNKEWGKWTYMEGSEVYTDINNAKKVVDETLKKIKKNNFKN